MAESGDPFDLARFVAAQDPVYPHVLAELREGCKRSHWMWFVFPQAAGLGRSRIAQHYAIGSAAEGRAYLEHPLLGPRLEQCTRLLLDHRDASAEAIFGRIDAMKLRSSLTLFAALAEPNSSYSDCMKAYFDGPDEATLALLRSES